MKFHAPVAAFFVFSVLSACGGGSSTGNGNSERVAFIESAADPQSVTGFADASSDILGGESFENIPLFSAKVVNGSGNPKVTLKETDTSYSISTSGLEITVNFDGNKVTLPFNSFFGAYTETIDGTVYFVERFDNSVSSGKSFPWPSKIPT